MELLELYIKPFVKSTLHTFSEFVGMELTAGNPHFTGLSVDYQSDISAVIGLSGTVRGAVVIAMKQNFAIKITDQLSGTKHTEIDADVVDAIGEIVNIVAGNIKQYVEGGEQIVISLPTVIKGPGHNFAWPSKHTRILSISFKDGEDSLFLLADMERVD
jgi:chemotaxis protein CheX